MNPRVLELIKNPKNIQSEDLGLLKEEIHAFPYIQNIRALHLYGVHLYEKENYQKELSITAAYTTDKKILYQLINGKIQQELQQEVNESKPSVIAAEKPVKYNYNVKGFPIKREETASVSEIVEEETKEACVLPIAQDIKHLYVNGERNRILFEGEENFLDEENPEIIDLESTLESGTLVTQKSEPEIIEPILAVEKLQKDAEDNIGGNFTPETFINEDQIVSEAVEDKVEKEENLSFEETESLLPDLKIEEDIAESLTEDAEAIANEEIAEEPDAELSFHGTDEFLPDVKIHTNNEETTETTEVPILNINKHEDEMRRLIEEVEKKMKETKSVQQEEQVEPELAEDHEISFADTQSFHFWSTDQESAEKSEEIKQEQVQEELVEQHLEPETESPKEENKEEPISEVQTAWKPMSLESNIPDSLINKQIEATAPVIHIPVVEDILPSEIKAENVEAVEEPESVIEIPAEDLSVEEAEEQVEPEETPNSDSQKEDVPVMNVSFFGADISTLKVGESKDNTEEPMKEAAVESISQTAINSNVPGFINTWQSWLKIGRTDEVEKEKEDIKEKAIETFIENNPRISQLKEESTYVIKEKNDDISHLMTETLANLYFEQKLYSKAIKAFEILIKKRPEKKAYFETKIKDIKDFRSKN